MRLIRGLRKSVRCVACLCASLAVLPLLSGCDGGNVAGGGTPAVSQTIGGGGGEVINGNATLTVAGTSSTTTGSALYSVQQTNSFPADTRVVPGTAFNFSSSAATLPSTITISIRYNGGNLPKGAQENSLQLYQVVSGAWTLVSGSTLDVNNKVVSATVSSLGTYAILASTIVSTGGTGGTGGNRATALLFLSNSGTSTASTLYSSSVGSSTVTPISTTGQLNSEIVGNAAFAPDAKSLVFDSQSNNGDLLVVAQADASSIKSVVSGGLQPSNQLAQPRSASYSADGKTIVFIYNQTGADQIYTIKPDGSSLTQVTRNLSLANLNNAAFTKSGVITFTSTANANSTTTQYNVVNTDGTGLSTNTTFSPNVAPWYTYSPDGTKIVYVGQTNNTFDVFTTNANGSSPTQITKLSASSIGNPRFSADGTQILFSATTTASPVSNLYAIKTDGTGQQALNTPLSGNNLILLDAR